MDVSLMRPKCDSKRLVFVPLCIHDDQIGATYVFGIHEPAVRKMWRCVGNERMQSSRPALHQCLARSLKSRVRYEIGAQNISMRARNPTDPSFAVSGGDNISSEFGQSKARLGPTLSA